MGDIKRLDIVDIELNSGNLHRSWLNHSIGSGDNNANAFGVRLFRNSEPVDIGAGWVQGFFRNSQGQNIALTENGVIDGNMTYVTLPQACYNYEGQFTLAIKLVSPGFTSTVTMRIVDGIVDNTNTGGAVAPTGTVPTYQEILAVYDDLVASLEEVEDYADNFAPEFAAGTANAAGSYVMYEGDMYLLPNGHTANTTWANTTKTQVNVGGQLTDLKSAINDKLDAYLGDDNVIYEEQSMSVGTPGGTYQQKVFYEYTGTIALGDKYGFITDSVVGATVSAIRIKVMNGSTQIRDIANSSNAYVEITSSDISAGVNKLVAYVYASTSTPLTQVCVVSKPKFIKGWAYSFDYSNAFNTAVKALADGQIADTIFGGTISDTSVYSSCDDLPAGKTFTIIYGSGIANNPAVEGTITTFGRLKNEQIALAQLYFSKTGAMYVRVKWATWTNWFEIAENLTQAFDDAVSITLGSLINGFVNSTTGARVAADSYRRTDYLLVHAKKLTVGVATTASSVGIAFYDNAKKFISGADFSSSSIGAEVEVAVPETAKYFIYCGIATNAQYLHVKIAHLADAISMETTNPCFWNESQECRTFKKILCIGDSLTDGRFDYKEGGVTKEFNDKNYAYPTFLKALTGRDITNAGDAGETTVSWYELHQNDDLSGHDACIIMLGRNDYVSGRETTSAQRATAFANIIAKVRNENPQITIFLSTLINYYTGSGADTMNTDIRTAATTNNCYLLDISAYGKMKLADDAYSHCTAVGYMTLAEYFFKYISYIMHMNYSQFKTVQFTGTNRSYS